MKYYNIFQGNELIRETIFDTLKIDKEKNRYGIETIYFEAFFYLTKRFGMPKIFDDYKDAANWIFRVKEFKIWIRLNSYAVEIMIYGNSKYKDYSMSTPYHVAKFRSIENKPQHIFFTWIKNENHKLTEKQKATNQKVWKLFCEKYGIDENITDEEYSKSGMQNNFFYFVNKYNEKISGVNFDFFSKKYGHIYKNAKTKYALKILRKFLQNMLVPISIRDGYFNILGKCSYDDRYKNNIEVKLDSIHNETENKWFKISEKLPEINDNIQLLVKTKFTQLNQSNFEIARYTKYGFHYGTRNTQDIIPNNDILEWRYIK